MSTGMDCNFCGKQFGECEVLIVGPQVDICDECVLSCLSIITEHYARWSTEEMIAQIDHDAASQCVCW